MSEEKQYLRLVRDVIDTGCRKTDRTGVGTLSKFGCTMRFSLLDNAFPLFTTKRMFFRGIVEELLFFVRGQTDNRILTEKKVNVWTRNARGNDDLGPIYGFQWRHFGARYETCEKDYSGEGIDQLERVVRDIRNDPSSRRLVVTAWNPADLNAMALPPCHCTFQFQVTENRLNCCLFQRSGDLGLGVPFNVASYSLLTAMVARVTDLEPGEFVHFIGDAHVYLNHVEALKEQFKCEPFEFPKLFVSEKKENLEDYEFSNFKLSNYRHHPPIKMEMAV